MRLLHSLVLFFCNLSRNLVVCNWKEVPNGYCCKKGIIDGGCDGELGTETRHICVTPRKSCKCKNRDLFIFFLFYQQEISPWTDPQNRVVHIQATRGSPLDIQSLQMMATKTTFTLLNLVNIQRKKQIQNGRWENLLQEVNILDFRMSR